jgi:hypothetical protein
MPSSNSTQKRLYAFGEKLERGFHPLSNIRRFLTSFDMTNLLVFLSFGVSGKGSFTLPTIGRSFATLRTTINGGGMSPLLQLHPKTETEEISRYARNEKLVSFCLLGGSSKESFTHFDYLSPRNAGL